MLKKTTILLDDINDKVFKIGDIVTVTTRGIGLIEKGKVIKIEDDRIHLDTSKEYTSRQVEIFKRTNPRVEVGGISGDRYK